MRLKQIKLVGFKSFVDPTVVPFPDNLTAIVGPNGCGKSNLIDAVRWVMGESSAKHLRGDSMADVIFNGSTARKPVAQASIELVFDNSDGTITGEYANYNEIAIKRSVTRDGQSTYFLNNTRCRRKDITDIFLGTGLGPRSYAIIEQGMISRLIESKPQELRVFLEEAAGISKYKERRRETENRIRHTRENLDRLTDLREELGKQLAHLQRQAKAAEKYKNFKAEERELKAQLSAIRWQDYDKKVATLSHAIGDCEVELEAKIAQQRSADAGIEEHREAHIELSDGFNEVQARYYGLGADIARVEQAIKHNRERKQQILEDVSQTESSLKHLAEQLQQDEDKTETLQAELMESEPELEIQQEAVEEAQNKLLEMEDDALKWQGEWDGFNQQAAQNAQKSQVESTRIQHLESHISRLSNRLENLDQELSLLSSEPMEDSLVEASVELTKAEQNTQALQQLVSEQVAKIAQLRDDRREQIRQLEEKSSELRQLQGKKVSLQALQRAALGKENKQTLHWLEKKHWQDNRRLAECLKVDDDWQAAAELVLGEHLEAVVIDDLGQATNELDELLDGALTFIELDGQDGLNHGLESLAQAESLSSKIHNAHTVQHLISGIFVTEDLSTALTLRATLKPGQSLVTKDGFWLGANWLRVSRNLNEEGSLLERENELKELEVKIEQKEEIQQQAEAKVDELRITLAQLEEEWDHKQKELNQANALYSELRAKVGGQQAKLEQIRQRKEKLNHEKISIAEQIKEDETALVGSRTLLEEMLEQMAEDTDKKEELTSLRDERRNMLEQARHKAREAKDIYHKLALRVESVRTELNSTKSSLQRLHQQITERSSRKQSLETNLSALSTPIQELEKELEEALEKRVIVEKELTEAREKLNAVEQELKQIERKRSDAEQSAHVIRNQLEKLRMDWQQSKTLQTTQAQSLSEHNESLEEVVASLPEEANENDWQQRLSDLAGKIQRLGAINLAAIEEYNQQEERKVYLDSQNDDLLAALETLESAIRKIDKETRSRFKETFDKVNKGLQELFPKVFGGGHAYLELTGDDLLDTGVTVMARPPGKRNSTIHLLSGGEKALTALALVFSIFRLNPAPFCMLDEVDAPLDDANVGRFCNLVKEMSEHVQFIYITHNKVSMEMAHHLSGVTMHEAGVSRMVSVDVEEAAALAAS